MSKIYIGKANDNVVFIDTKTNEAFKAKSKNAQKSNSKPYNPKTGLYAAVFGLIGLPPLLGLIVSILKRNINVEHVVYTKPILFFMVLAWAAICFVPNFLLLHAENKLKKNLVPASSLDVVQAYRTSPLTAIKFMKPKNGRVCVGNKVAALALEMLFGGLVFGVTFFMLLQLGTIFFTKQVNFLPDDWYFLNQPFDIGMLVGFICYGIVSFTGYFMTVFKSPYRWLRAVEKYEDKALQELKRKEDGDKIIPLQTIALLKTILPLGTVVRLKYGDDTPLLIIGRASVIESNIKGVTDVYYDYVSVAIPEGMKSPDAVYHFNREDVKEVLFQGFMNVKEINYENHYDEMVSLKGIRKGN